MPDKAGFAMIGFGAIGAEIAATLNRIGEADTCKAILVRPGRSAPKPVFDVEALIATAPSVVLECAGHGAITDYGPAVLRAGIDLVISSVGALADPALRDHLHAAEQAGGGRALLPAGAIAGLDGLAAARLMGIDHVTYTSYKPPHAWAGTAAEQVLDLGHAEPERVFFEGNAREAALSYPKNANVSVAIALAGIGMERTRVRLVSSRLVTDPVGLIEAEGPFGRFHFDIFARAAPDNPKTSALTAYSLLQCARLGNGLPIFRLLSDVI
ncbi:aspartate dehydrogenase [Niveispirillum irakense]|uniref:aspartate dehydrogenase n=1 Tax=Niveispirillum irakense TaxID=34011 RepID=UPI00048D715B|nr:aspartate dehydrogenase [Niveispirillum irakense]